MHLIFILKFTDDLQENIHPQITKFCQLVLIIPATTGPSERSMSTWKRIQTFFRNTMIDD